MATEFPANRFRPILFDDVPLAREVETVGSIRISRPSGIEYFLKCMAPSPGLRAQGVYDYRPCTNFLSKVYFEAAKSPFRDVCIFFNGLDETPHNLNSHELFGFYDALGKTLASHGMLAILLPSPFHLNRSLVYKDQESATEFRSLKGPRFVDLTRPSNAMIKAPQNLYVNHYQSFRELISLCRSIIPGRFSRDTKSRLESVCATRSLVPNQASHFLRGKLDSNARISLIGYSMGALRVMTAFCFAWEMAVECGEEPLFTSCISINSGGSFSSMSAPRWVDSASWGAMIRVLNLKSFTTELESRFPEEQETFRSYCKYIRDVTLGNALKFRQLEESDAEFTRRLLFILGGSDDIMRLSSLHRITPRGGLNIFQVAGVGHMFRHGEWGTQLGGMLEHVNNFIAASSKDAGELSSREIVEFLSLVDWKIRIFPYDSGRMYSEEGRASDITTAITDLENRGEEDCFQLAAAILLPIELQNGEPMEESKKLKSCYGDERAAELAKEASEFVRNKLLFELGRRIEAGDCHPGLYSQTRRSLLLGWIICKNKILVRHWKGLQQHTGVGKKFGDVLVDLGVAPRSLVDSSLREQRSLLEAVRAKMFRSFRLTCREKGIPLESTPRSADDCS